MIPGSFLVFIGVYPGLEVFALSRGIRERSVGGSRGYAGGMLGVRRAGALETPSIPPRNPLGTPSQPPRNPLDTKTKKRRAEKDVPFIKRTG